MLVVPMLGSLFGFFFCSKIRIYSLKAEHTLSQWPGRCAGFMLQNIPGLLKLLRQTVMGVL